MTGMPCVTATYHTLALHGCLCGLSCKYTLVALNPTSPKEGSPLLTHAMPRRLLHQLTRVPGAGHHQVQGLTEALPCITAPYYHTLALPGGLCWLSCPARANPGC